MADGPTLLAHHRSLTARYAARLGRTQAEDLASEAIARALRRPAPDGRFGPWLERIVQNLVADQFRQRRRAGTGARRTPPPIAAPSPEQELLRAEARRLLASALPAVADELRQAVELR